MIAVAGDGAALPAATSGRRARAAEQYAPAARTLSSVSSPSPPSMRTEPNAVFSTMSSPAPAATLMRPGRVPVPGMKRITPRSPRSPRSTTTPAAVGVARIAVGIAERLPERNGRHQAATRRRRHGVGELDLTAAAGEARSHRSARRRPRGTSPAARSRAAGGRVEAPATVTAAQTKTAAERQAPCIARSYASGFAPGAALCRGHQLHLGPVSALRGSSGGIALVRGRCDGSRLRPARSVTTARIHARTADGHRARGRSVTSACPRARRA